MGKVQGLNTVEFRTIRADKSDQTPAEEEGEKTNT